MLNEERRRAILATLNRDGRVLVTELARQFETSQVTIRKDLEILHSHGLVHRTHGGALPSREGALEDPTLREKEKLHRKEKLAIAAAAADLVKEGQVVILDSGTTTTAIARALREFQNLTIVTNAVNIAAELSGAAVEVILTGGTLRKNSFSLVGPIAEENFAATERRHPVSGRRWIRRSIRFEHAQHFGSQGQPRDGRGGEANGRGMRLQQIFGRRSLSLIVPPSALHEVITDRAAPKADLRTLKKAGIEVKIV